MRVEEEETVMMKKKKNDDDDEEHGETNNNNSRNVLGKIQHPTYSPPCPLMPQSQELLRGGRSQTERNALNAHNRCVCSQSDKRLSAPLCLPMPTTPYYIDR